ncbi:hypothetical protein [Rhodococcus sp. IEGM 1330]|uniref:hypothetical protein n=1 Tax=Rhodococcus sp. IEGM 1330 TaxID=3082225 RepID=UPI00295436B5|nr:hypothetical protein [Rhodococcus sp. IEGM 1330]MDV8023009.1 hypothetical protein [Rhodococcus sp. IEGM 1330]
MRIDRVMTGNHFSYTLSTDVAEAMADLSAEHVFVRPHCPCRNRKVERCNRTLQVGWAYRQVFLTNAERSNVITPSREFRNTGRAPSASGGLPPISRLS